MATAASKIHLDFSFCLQIFWIELNLLVLLFPPGLHVQWIAEIVVMKVKRRFIVPVSIGRHGLTVGDSGVLNKHLNIGAAFAIHPAHKSFDREPMVRLMCRSQDTGKEKGKADTDENQNSVSSKARHPYARHHHSVSQSPVFATQPTDASITFRPILRPTYLT